jgi:hypothetical protein
MPKDFPGGPTWSSQDGVALFSSMAASGTYTDARRVGCPLLALQRAGWRVFVVWECQLQTVRQRDATLAKLAAKLATEA